MNTREIEILLDKYFEGETSLDEERRLKTFFSSKDVPEHLLKHRQIFSYFNESGTETMKNFTPVISLDPKPSRFYYISGIAASILLLIGLFFTFRHDVFNKKMNTPDTQQEMAFNQAREALLMVSVGLNTGLDQMQRLEVFNNAIENAQKLNKFYQCQTLIINPDEKPNQSKKP